jgi:hypothetical protein
MSEGSARKRLLLAALNASYQTVTICRKDALQTSGVHASFAELARQNVRRPLEPVHVVVDERSVILWTVIK